MRTTLGFSLDTEEHADIIKWSKEQENLSGSIRQAIRAYVESDTTLAEIKQMMLEGIRLAPQETVVDDKPQEKSEMVLRAEAKIANLGR